MRSQEEGVQWKEEYEKCAEKLKQLEILSKDGEFHKLSTSEIRLGYCFIMK